MSGPMSMHLVSFVNDKHIRLTVNQRKWTLEVQWVLSNSMLDYTQTGIIDSGTKVDLFVVIPLTKEELGSHCQRQV